MGFDIRFKSNVSLPDYIGLGKGVSIGFGMIKDYKNNKYGLFERTFISVGYAEQHQQP